MNQETLKYNSISTESTTFAPCIRKRDKPIRSDLGRLLDELSEKARKDIFSFLEHIGLVSDTHMMIIPSTRHFFYDAEELREIKAIINLKQPNHIKDTKKYLRTISEILPHRSNFMGCFVDNRAQGGLSDDARRQTDKTETYENGIESRIPFTNRMYSLMDLRTNS